MIEQIYIRLLEGTQTYVPLKARRMPDGSYKILDNPYLQLEDDITSIWEFFPGDVVQCRKEDNDLIAYELLASSFKNRRLYQLIFSIVLNQGDLSLVELDTFKDDIVKLCRARNIPQKDHPVVKKWLLSTCKQ